MAAILIRHKNVWNQPIRQSNASNRIQLRHLGTRAVFKISMPPFPSPKDIPKLEIRERVATNGGGRGRGWGREERRNFRREGRVNGPSSLSYGSFAWVIINVARDKRRFSLPRRADDVATFLAARRARFMAARR